MFPRHIFAITIAISLVQLALPGASRAVTDSARRAEDLIVFSQLRPQRSEHHAVDGVAGVVALKCPSVYSVRYGETLYSIAARCGADAATLRRLNGLRSARVWPGQRLYIPAPKTVPALHPTPAP